jgi:hypothetical protein
MRFMLIVKADRNTEQAVLPTREMLEEMTQFNEEMARAGVLIAAEGLHPSTRGARVIFRDGQRIVVNGPFPDVTSLVAGYWLINAPSLEAAVDWAKRSPNPMGEGHEAEIEIRPIMEAGDFPAELFPPEAAAREQALRETLEQNVPRH